MSRGRDRAPSAIGRMASIGCAVGWLIVTAIAATTARAATAGAAVPAALTEVNPFQALRWRAVELRSVQGGSDTSALAPGQVIEAALPDAPVLRIHGTFAVGCDPLVSRRFHHVLPAAATAQRTDAFIDVPVPVSPPSSLSERLLVLPPPMAPDGSDDGASVQVALTLPAGCARTPVRLFAADDDPDPIAGRRVFEELRALAVQIRRAPVSDGALAAWLQAPHPHLWQEQAALALALPRLLAASAAASDRARMVAHPSAAELLADAWLDFATAQLRTQDPGYTNVAPLAIPGPARRVPGDGDDWAVIAAGQSVDLAVEDLEAIRIVHRSGAATSAGAGAVVAWRSIARFDADRARTLLAFAPVDPVASDLSRARTITLSVPPGARRLRLQAIDRPWLVQVVGLRAKSSVADLLGAPARRRLAALAALADASSRSTAGRLAAAFLRRPGASRATGTPDAAVLIPTALVALLRAQSSRDVDEAGQSLDALAGWLAAVQTPLERAAASLLDQMAVRIRAQLAIDAGNPGQALSLFLGRAARAALCDDDAFALLDADAFAQEALTGSPQALQVVDGLLARRPLDRALALARQRAFAGAARWQELSIDPGPREVAFLDDLPAQAQATAEHAVFTPLPSDREQLVVLPTPPLPGQMPMLSLVSLRARGGPAVLRVRIDDTPFTVPAVGPFERVDLPVRPGRHRVRVDGLTSASQVNTNWAVNGEGAQRRRWRRYIQLGQIPLELHNRDVGPADLLLVAVRAVGPDGPRLGPFRLRLEGDAMKPIELRVQPGAGNAAGLPSGDVDVGTTVGDPIEAVLPVASANPSYRISVVHAPPEARILVHVSARRRRPAAPPTEPAAEVRDSIARALARDEANLPAVAASTRRLTSSAAPDPTEYLARAVALTGLDEPTLAREDLVRAISSGALDPAARNLALTIWRHLDNVASSSSPATIDGRSAWVYAPGSGFVTEAIPRALAALGRLVDDRAALRALDPDAADAPREAAQATPFAATREAPSPAAGRARFTSFALLAAARQAERDGDGQRAARLWQRLAVARSASGLYARAGSALLALPPDPLRDARAYVALFEATRLDPHDPVAARLLRRATARTRLRPIHEVDESAGAIVVERAGTDLFATTVEAALLPPDEAHLGELVTADSQLTLSFDLATPLSLRMAAVARELRPEGARAVGRTPIALEWIRDGQTPHRIPCTGRISGVCKGAPIALPAGRHSLIVRLRGGLRPAARVTMESEAPAAGGGHGPRAPVERSAEYLVARPDQPIAVTLFGPAVIQAELRTPPGSGPLGVSLALSPKSGPPRAPMMVALPGSTSGGGTQQIGGRQVVALRVPGSSNVAPATVQALVLERDEPYRLEIVPDRGQALCRLFARDGAGADATRRPPVPATLLAPDPSPLLAPPDLEQALVARLRDGDVSPGWDDFGAVTAELGWRSAVDRTDQAGDVVARGAAVASLTYRRLIETLHLTLKGGAELRRWQKGDPSLAGQLDAYFVHPDARWARVVLGLDGITQNVAGVRAQALQAVAMFEPIVTLRSGVHVVSKLGARLQQQSLARPATGQLVLIDPDVYSARVARDPRALFWEEGLELAPLSDLLLYAGGRVTSHADLSLRHPDHASASAVARTALGRLFFEAGLRASWFFADADRARALLLRTAALTASHTFWVGHTHAITLALQAAEHIDLHIPELGLTLGWELSNGRRLRDHTPVEGENYFYPQRGPGRESGRLTVGTEP
jgi:hypothetical protein